MVIDETSGSTRYIARNFGSAVEVTYTLSSYHPVREFDDYLGIDMIINHLHFLTRLKG